MKTRLWPAVALIVAGMSLMGCEALLVGAGAAGGAAVGSEIADDD